MDSVLSDISQFLDGSEYICSTLTRLSNGTTNSVFLGELAQPLIKGSSKTTIIVKYFKQTELNNGLTLDTSRCNVEVYMLNTIPVQYGRLPTVYKSNDHIEVLEYLEATDLKSMLQECEDSIMVQLGRWLLDFHESDIRLLPLNDNRELKRGITVGSIEAIIHGYLGDDTCYRVMHAAKMADGDGRQGIVHGDFWTGNVLLSEPNRNDIAIIDWEFSHIGNQAADLGQLLGDLFERSQFEGWETQSLIEAFISGYGPVERSFAYQVVIYFGIHLITWINRGPPLHLRPAYATKEKACAIVNLGSQFILHTEQADVDWLAASTIGSLFRS